MRNQYLNLDRKTPAELRAIRKQAVAHTAALFWDLRSTDRSHEPAPSRSAARYPK